jgi:Putative  PD-(D/E)XK family member, (DUF4420)
MIDDPRYLSEAALDEFLSSKPKTAVRITGVPEIQLVFLTGKDGGVALRVDWDGNSMPDLSEYAHLSADIVRTGDRAWAELLIDDPDVFRRAVPAVWRIADRIQSEQIGFAAAVVATLADFCELLEGAPGMSAEMELGLFGELTVLDFLISGTSGSEAVAAWRGPNGDEHDFDLGFGDLEVKATTLEKRVHWIGSLGQLTPTPGRKLWLLSVQFTTGLKGGATTAELIGKLRSRLSGADQGVFEKKLFAAGWRDRYATKIQRRFRLRSTPLLLPVNADFPALTQERVAAAGMPLSRLREIAYSVDVTGLAEEPRPPAAISQFVNKGGTW